MGLMFIVMFWRPFGFGTMTLVLKTALALGGGAAGMLLWLIGFTAHGHPTEVMLGELRAGALLLPAFLFAMSALLMAGYRLSSEMHLRIRGDLAAGTAQAWPRTLGAAQEHGARIEPSLGQ